MTEQSALSSNSEVEAQLYETKMIRLLFGLGCVNVLKQR